jgi:hypothetical protein
LSQKKFERKFGVDYGMIAVAKELIYIHTDTAISLLLELILPGDVTLTVLMNFSPLL